MLFYMANNLSDSTVIVMKDGVQVERFTVNLPCIRSLKGFLSGTWDLSLFKEAFPLRNRLSDVDGSIELNGHTLVLEFKQSNRAMTSGQVMKAIRQAKHSNICTLFIFGKTNNPVGYKLFTPNQLTPSYVEADLSKIINVMKQWVAYTEKNTLAENKTEEWNLVREQMYKDK